MRVGEKTVSMKNGRIRMQIKALRVSQHMKLSCNGKSKWNLIALLFWKLKVTRVAVASC